MNRWIEKLPTLSALLLLGLFASASAGLGTLREWESADGRKIKASVTKLNPEDATVEMRREDGLAFTIGLNQFATDDARLLEKAMEEVKKKSFEPNPATAQDKPPAEFPDRFECDDVPMVKQKGNFCVPASATMIAGFHGIETDQDQIAFLSSAASFNNQGTVPLDMFLAMQKLGFDGRAIYWSKESDFLKQVLPEIRKALVMHGPIYISFREGVFGGSGHGCVVVGYHDRKEELIFHNPWGSVFERSYARVAREARGIVIIFPPKPAPIASETFIHKVRKVVPKFEGDFPALTRRLKQNGLNYELIWCSRADAREDRRFAVNTARDDGRKILDLAFHRNPAVILPRSDRDGVTEKFVLVTRPPGGGASFLVREISEDGWSEPEIATLGSLTRTWPTRIADPRSANLIWELPIIELHPGD